MVSYETMRRWALSLPETTELPHFERTSFRVNKKIFATLAEDQGLAMLRLSLEDQDVFTAMGKGACYPVPGGWGKQGATYFELDKIDPVLFQDALTVSWKTVAPPKLVKLHDPEKKSPPEV